jgi:tetratricopeptide (TPR) repeat protein
LLKNLNSIVSFFTEFQSMKKQTVLFFFLIVLGYGNIVFSQDRAAIDSLKKLIPENPGPKNTQDMYNLANQYSSFGLSPDSIQPILDQILAIADKYDHTASYVRGYFLKGVLAFREQDLQQSLSYFLSAYAILDTSYYTDWQVSIPNALGVVYSTLEQNNSAVEHYLKAISVAEKNGHTIGLPQAYSNLSILLLNMDETQRAMEPLRKAMALNTAQGSKVRYITNMYNLTNLFVKENQYDSAVYYGSQVLEQSEAIGYTMGIVRGHKSLSNTYLLSGEFARSIQHADWVLQHKDKSPERPIDRLMAYRTLAVAYASTGKRYAARQSIDSTLVLLEQINFPMYIHESYEKLSKAHEKLGDYKEALKYYQAFHHLKDSLHSEETRKRTLSLMEMYESEKKEREVLALSMETARQSAKLKRRNQMIWFLAGLTVLVLLSMYLILKQREYRAKEKALEAEQRLLRIQMNPHFLFNTLSSIQNYLFDKDDIKKALHYLARFSELMRQVLEYGRETFISLEDELDTLNNYLSLQQLRFDYRFNYEIILDPELNPWEVNIPPLMAQPFVENAIEHGKVHEVEGGKVCIHFQKEGENIRLRVEDNGKGMNQSKSMKAMKNHKSLATQITKDRLAVLSELTRKKFRFTIKDLPKQGTRVEFDLPLTE